jgi:heptosyltransferase-2
MNNTTNKILIIGPSWVGDTVMAQCLFKILKQQNPDVQIDVLAQKFLHPLLERMPEINKSIELNVKHGELGLKKRYRLAKTLRNENYSQAIILPNSLKSALIPWLAKIPEKTGWRGEWRYGLLNDLRILDKKQYPLMIERFMALGLPFDAELPEEYPFPKLAIDKSIALNTTAVIPAKAGIQKTAMDPRSTSLVGDDTSQMSQPKPILALCPGAEYGQAKRWPTEYFAEVANTKLNENWQVWLFGGNKDVEIGEIIQNKTQQRCANLIGKTNLGEAIDLLSLADFAITNDSGLMHIAAALDLSIIAIYGSSSPTFTPPLSNKTKILTSKISCSPCFKRKCKFGHYKCLHETTPDQVLKLLGEF